MPEVDEAVPKTNVACRTARDARMPATVDVVASAVRRRHDVVGCNLGTMTWYGEVADLTTTLVDQPPATCVLSSAVSGGTRMLAYLINHIVQGMTTNVAMTACHQIHHIVTPDCSVGLTV